MKHLSEAERTIIMYELKNGKSIKEISNNLKKSTSTISREIKRNRQIVRNKKRIGISEIMSIEKHICSILQKSPYVCNNCPKYNNNTCTYDYVVYDNNISQELYKSRVSSVKYKKINKYDNILEHIQEKLDLGQPIHHILTNITLKEKPSKTTIYNLINSGKLKYEKVKQKRKLNKEISKLEYISREKMLVGKAYIDFLEYVEKNPKDFVVEIDLLCGSLSSTEYVLSMFIASIQFLILIKLKNKKAISVIEALDNIERKIGKSKFKRMFGIILTDRGSEFLRYKEIESSIYSGKRCKIFYCDKSSPYQKPNVENIHRLFRRYIPKGHSFKNYTQDDFDYIASNLNSLIKEKYGNKTPNEMFINYFGKTTLKKLSLEVINGSDIIILKYLK